MGTYHVLYNPLAGNKTGKESAKEVNRFFDGEELKFTDITAISDYGEFFASFGEEDNIILCGGDGTLNHFVNNVDCDRLKWDVFYYATGSGNDFLHDLNKSKEDGPFLINDYIKNLPSVTVNGMTRKFINGIGYGIDGYCCEVGDRMRSKTDKPINYALIAIKGLLYGYKPKNAVVSVDGDEMYYKHVWLAPTMNGRFYGGGMDTAPEQDRLNPERNVSTVVMYGTGKLKTLIVFPSIFEGKHIEHTEMVTVKTGHNVTVKFDEPCALQIDGETVLDVSEYSVTTHVCEKATL